ncbi:MAG: hypothetical protein M0R51_08005 [Clostridia bacterium]|jgi:hypothetical protein|nr:hypothetical protein [Clostridia bacterium]
MTNAEIKKAITDELKANGINSKQVSISVRDSRYDTSIYATIRDITLKQSDIEKIVNTHESIRWDDHCQEILQGCNTFCTVQYDHAAMEQYREDNHIMDKCTAIYNAAHEKDVNGNIYLHEVIEGDPRFLFTTSANKRDGEGLHIKTQEGTKNWRLYGPCDLVGCMAHYLLGHYGTLEAFKEWEKVEKEKFLEVCRLADIERKAAEIRQAEHQTTHNRMIESINKNSVCVPIPEEEKKIITSLKWANLNKNNSIDEYYQEVEKGDFYRQDAKASHMWVFSDFAAFDYLRHHLLSDYKQLAGLGGTYSDDPRLDNYKTSWNIPREIMDTVKWVNIGVAVYLGNDFQFFIDPQGHNYARYVALSDSCHSSGLVQ